MLKISYLIYFFLAYIAIVMRVSAQVTFVVNDFPSNTPAQADLYISGSFDNWSGGNATYKLTKNANNTYSIVFAQQTGTLQFKFTRGSWASVEKGANGEEIANRTYSFGGNGAVVNIKVHKWADLSGGGGNSTATSNVSMMSANFVMPQFNGRMRRIWVYLPPNYNSSTASFPVIYMHDGQNLFDNLTSFSGEWQVDETLNALYAEKGLAFIVVGIDNGGNERINEYTPWANAQYGGGEGAKYMNFIVQTLKPYIDAQYRTLPDKQNTALIGSSLGGLISHFGALEHANTFGKVGVFSPSFWFSDAVYTFSENKGNVMDCKMYFLAGGSESASMVPNVENVITKIQNAGFPAAQIQKKIVANGTHSESFWRSEFKPAVEWLFSNTPLQNEETNRLSLKVYPNPVGEELMIQAQDFRTYQLEFVNMMGITVFSSTFVNTYKTQTAILPKGCYILKISQGKNTFVTKIIKL